MTVCDLSICSIPFGPQVQHKARSNSIWKFSVDLVCYQVQHAVLFALPVVHDQHRIFTFKNLFFAHYAGITTRKCPRQRKIARKKWFVLEKRTSKQDLQRKCIFFSIRTRTDAMAWHSKNFASINWKEKLSWVPGMLQQWSVKNERITRWVIRLAVYAKKI